MNVGLAFQSLASSICFTLVYLRHMENHYDRLIDGTLLFSGVIYGIGAIVLAIRESR